jgi:hypothetical protein
MDSARRFALIAAALTAAALAACGGAGPVPSISLGGSGSPSPGSGSPTPSPPGFVVCGRPVARSEPVAAAQAGIRLDAAALLSATVRVAGPPAAAPRCIVPDGRGETYDLHPGDRLQFVANAAPQHSPSPAGVVGVTTAPGPPATGPGPGDMPPTPHVIVTVTARLPGTVAVTWEDCSGTGC